MSAQELDRDTPGIFQVWEHDMEEVGRDANGVHNVGGCEPEQLAETELTTYGALGRLLTWMHECLPDSSPLVGRKDVQDDEGEFSVYLTFDCRAYLKAA